MMSAACRDAGSAALRPQRLAGLLAIAIAIAITFAWQPALAVDAARSTGSAPAMPPGFRDPGLPPALRADAPADARAHALAAVRAAPQASGAALDAEVQRNLRESFDAADVKHRGALTREEARAGGFGYIARHFEAIDTRHAGEVTFADLQAYLARRAAAR